MNQLWLILMIATLVAMSVTVAVWYGMELVQRLNATLHARHEKKSVQAQADALLAQAKDRQAK